MIQAPAMIQTSLGADAQWRIVDMRSDQAGPVHRRLIKLKADRNQ
jgi:hypothetical protein